jgi:hypothetical protein
MDLSCSTSSSISTHLHIQKMILCWGISKHQKERDLNITLVPGVSMFKLKQYVPSKEITFWMSKNTTSPRMFTTEFQGEVSTGTTLSLLEVSDVRASDI